jgi:hypothetical protein
LIAIARELGFQIRVAGEEIASWKLDNEGCAEGVEKRIDQEEQRDEKEEEEEEKGHIRKKKEPAQVNHYQRLLSHRQICSKTQ